LKKDTCKETEKGKKDKKKMIQIAKNNKKGGVFIDRAKGV